VFEDLEATGGQLEELAQLCEAHVEEAGRRIGDILSLANSQTTVVAGLCRELEDADVTSGVARTGSRVTDYLARATERSARSRRVLVELAETTESVRMACREVEQSSVSTRVLTLQTRIEGVRLADAGHVGSTAQQVGALNRELSEVTGRMREHLDEFDSVLRAYRLAGSQAHRAMDDFVRGVGRLSDEIASFGRAASAELESFANKVSQANLRLVKLTGDALSSLQFQDPLTQEYRAIRAGLQTAQPALDALLARVERTVEAAAVPLRVSRECLSEVHDQSQRSLQILGGSRIRHPGARPLSESVHMARRTLDGEARRLLGHVGRMQALVQRAQGICASLIAAEEQIRFVSEQTRLVAANAAIKAARVGGKGRATSVIAGEMSRLNVRVCGAADRVHARTSDVQSMLPALIAGAREAEEGTAALVAEVLEVFETATTRLTELEASLRVGLRGQPEVVRQIAHISQQTVRILTFEDTLELRVGRVVADLRQRGAVNRGLEDPLEVIGEVPDAHPVEAGEFLMF
jgi:methyl-accepting chemotaxis protein